MNSTDNTTHAEETAAAQAQQALGQLLRETRKKAGFEIDEVARVLRISQRYLEALEDGRNQDLPGTTYAIGFVRSYAEYLKLDGEEIVRRYKAEAEVSGVKTNLIFPKPIPDSGVPGGAVLGLGVIVAAAAYGIWYWNSNTDSVQVTRVDPVPEHMAAPDDQSGDAAGEAVGESATAPDQSAAQADEVPSGEASAEPSAPAVDAAGSPEDVAVVEDERPEPQVAQQPVDEPTVAEPPVIEAPTEPAPAEAPQAEQPAVEAVAEPVPMPAPVPAPQEQAAPQTEAASPAEQAATPAPALTEPTADGASRITVRAKSNSWIQIRDEALDRLLFTRLLREGDEYEVPNRAGLRLMTGNAGALELMVDGKAVPAIGDAGEVRRNVELDPEKLKAGTAVSE